MNNNCINLKNMRTMISILSDMHMENYKIVLYEARDKKKSALKKFDIKSMIKDNINYIIDQNYNDNFDNIITHLMLHDTNRYGNPPASKKAVEKLKKYKINEEKIKEFGFENACAVCKDEFNIGEECLSMPCNHYFHGNCLMPWLKERNSCPVCRYELPTDDADFEEMKKIKMRNDNNNNIINNNNNANVQG